MPVITLDADLEPLIPSYLARRQEELVALQAALKRDDYVFLQSVGHNLKGSGAGYGLAAISTIGGELENAAQAADGTAAQQQVDALGAFLADLEIRYA